MQPILLSAIFISAGCSTACFDHVFHTEHAAEHILLGHSSDGKQKAPIECHGLAVDDAISVLPMMLCCCLHLDHSPINDANHVELFSTSLGHAGGNWPARYSCPWVPIKLTVKGVVFSFLSAGGKQASVCSKESQW